MLLGRCLSIDFSPYHLNNLLSNNLIVQIETLKASNKLPGVRNMILRDLFRFFFTVMLEKVL